jgi:hypothetical protein
MSAGQGLLDCIEPGVLHALLLPGPQAPTLTAAMPQELASLKMPREFTWIGSAERAAIRMNATIPASQVTAAWRSSLAPDATRAATIAALTASGWQVRQQLGGVAMAAFASPGSMSIGQSACREGSAVNFTASSMDGVTYLLFTIQRGGVLNTTCSQPERSIPATGFEKFVPHLEMPIDPATGAPARQQGSSAGSSNGGVTAETDFFVKDTAARVASQFARQMAGQGWTSDASWSGATTAGSTWSRRDGTALVVATLMVMAVDDQRMSARLRIVKP